MSDVLQPTKHGGIMASGAGSKMGAPSKPMVRVGGRPLIEFALREFEIASVEHVAVTARRSDRSLRDYLAQVARSGRFKDIEVLDVETNDGACAAIHALVEFAGDVPQFVSAADVVTAPGAYYDLSCFGVQRQPGQLLSVIGYMLSPPSEHEKKWVLLADRGPIVRDFGAGTTADHIEFAGVRWLDSAARQTLKSVVASYRCYDTLGTSEKRPISESQMQREMLAEPVLAIWMPGVNVNTPNDVARAERYLGSLARRVEPFMTLGLSTH